MHALLEQLLNGGSVLTDGAWGTELQRRGLSLGQFPDTWNLTHPDSVREVAAAYAAAGSQVILTNTFGANRIRLSDEPSVLDRVREINRRGVELSREGAGDRAVVFASIGPSGKLLITEEVTPDDLRRAFAEQAESLAEGGAQGLVIETMSDPDEARLAISAARETGLPVVACMVFDSGKDMDRTMMGTTPEETAALLTEAGADVVGANCGQGIDGFVSICRRMRGATDRPIWMKANAGLPEVIQGEVVYRTTPEQFADRIPDLIEAGANFLGGCCGSEPAFIQAARKRINSQKQTRPVVPDNQIRPCA